MEEDQTHFSEIAQGREPVVKVNPVQEDPKCYFGILKGNIEIAPDFDEPLSDELVLDFEN